MQNEISILSLIIDASFLVKLVIFILFLASVLSWSVIIKKFFLFRNTEKTMKSFEENFWESGLSFADLYEKISEKSPELHSAKVFYDGYNYLNNNKNSLTKQDLQNGLEKVMQVSMLRIIHFWEDSLSLLASVGSVSPYIGLFGTVWGIMNSFSALGNVRQATISMVAPGIAEALVATAIGLFAAIPAVVAYNFFMQKTRVLGERISHFIDEFVVISQINRNQDSHE